MQKSFRLILLPIALCLIFTAISGCSPAQKPIRDSQGVVYFLNQVEDNASRELWQEAGESVNELEDAWKRDRARLLTPRTREMVESFETSLGKLKIAVRKQDKKDTLELISSMKNDYRNISSP